MREISEAHCETRETGQITLEGNEMNTVSRIKCVSMALQRTGSPSVQLV